LVARGEPIKWIPLNINMIHKTFYHYKFIAQVRSILVKTGPSWRITNSLV
jgi:hypothetical protein